MNWSNLHSHCNYCDGRFEPERYAQRAFELGLISYGFSSHAPLPFKCEWAMNALNLNAYISEIDSLKEKYKDDIQLYKSLEVDYIPEVMGPNHPMIMALNLDYTIGSIHFIDTFSDGTPWEIDGKHSLFLKGLNEIFDGDLKKVIKRYFELTRQMIREDCPDIIGHLDKINIQNIDNKFYKRYSSWYQIEILYTLEEIAASNAIVEVNSRGLYTNKSFYTYPDNWVLKNICAMGIPITLNSDCHHPEEIINGFEKVAYMLQEIGFKHLMTYLDNKWVPVAFDTHGLKIFEYG